MELEPITCGVQHFEVGRRERRHREEAHASRPSFRPALHEGATKGVDGGDPVAGRPLLIVFAFSFDQALPQAGLPVRGRIPRPLADPVRPVQQTTVEDPGEAIRELEAFSRTSAREVAAHRHDRGLSRLLRESGQRVVDAPAQAGRSVGAFAADAGDRAAHDRPGEVRGELEAEVCGDAERARKLQSQPARHAPVRYHDPLRFEGIARSGEHPFRQNARERLHAVRVMEAQHSAHSPSSGEHRDSRGPDSPPFFTGVGIDLASPVSSTTTMPRPCVSVDNVFLPRRFRGHECNPMPRTHARVSRCFATGPGSSRR